MNVDGLIERQLYGVSGPVNYGGLLPIDGVVILPCCSATADFSSILLWQASWCSLSLVLSLFLVSPM